MYRLSVGGALLVALLHASAAWSYTVVTTDGRKLQAEGPPTFQGGKAVVVLTGGLKVEMAEADIDKAASEKANQGAAEAKAFTNDDLAKAKGLSSMEGDVKAEGMGSAMPAPQGSARPSPDSSGARRGSSSAAGRSSAMAQLTPDESAAYERLMAAEADAVKRHGDLTAEVARTCRRWDSMLKKWISNPDCDNSLHERLREAGEEVNRLGVEKTQARETLHVARLDAFQGRMDTQEREAIAAELSGRIALLKRQLTEIDRELHKSGASNAMTYTRRLATADELTKTEAELKAVRDR